MLKNFFFYSFISGSTVLASTIVSYILIEFYEINYNLTFVKTFLIFGYLNYYLNSKFNFRQKISIKKFIRYLFNITFTFIFVLSAVNLLVYFLENMSNLLIVLFFAGMSSLLNFSLNYFFVFKKNNN